MEPTSGAEPVANEKVYLERLELYSSYETWSALVRGAGDLVSEGCGEQGRRGP